jgi:hypothetical protein
MSLDYQEIYDRSRDQPAFSNSTEGEVWTANWCDRCLRDAPFRNGISPVGCLDRESDVDRAIAAELDRLVKRIGQLWPDPLGHFSAEQAHAARVMKQSALDQLAIRASELRGEA